MTTAACVTKSEISADLLNTIAFAPTCPKYAKVLSTTAFANLTNKNSAKQKYINVAAKLPKTAFLNSTAAFVKKMALNCANRNTCTIALATKIRKNVVVFLTMFARAQFQSMAAWCKQLTNAFVPRKNQSVLPTNMSVCA